MTAIHLQQNNLLLALGCAIFNDSLYIDTKSSGSLEREISMTFNALANNNSCQYAFDGECDDSYFGALGSACSYNTDSFDCGTRYALPTHYAQYLDGMNQNISEYIVAGILWNLASGSTLHVGTTYRPIIDVLSNYFTLDNFSLYDIGVQGIDLADFIKGFQCYESPELYNAINSLVSLYHWPIDRVSCQ